MDLDRSRPHAPSLSTHLRRVIIQSVLYQARPSATRRFMDALASQQTPLGCRLQIRLGDCSDSPLLGPDEVAAYRAALRGDHGIDFTYTFFGGNLGFSTSHNVLWNEDPEGDHLLVINPDTLPAHHLLMRLLEMADSVRDYGAIEARQIPLEHPKRFDPRTFEAKWVTGACVLIDARSFVEVGGFDNLFFLYCEDVDLSWRLRALGKRLYYCPNTFVYHAKRIAGRHVVMSAAESFHGKLGALVLRAKYGRLDVSNRIAEAMRGSGDPVLVDVATAYEQLRPTIQVADEALIRIADIGPNGEYVDSRWTYPLSDRYP